MGRKKKIKPTYPPGPKELREWKISTRYQHHVNGGTIEWTDWFTHFFDYYESEKEAKDMIKKYKAENNSIDRKTKLKHEYKVEKNENKIN